MGYCLRDPNVPPSSLIKTLASLPLVLLKTSGYTLLFLQCLPKEIQKTSTMPYLLLTWKNQNSSPVINLYISMMYPVYPIFHSLVSNKYLLTLIFMWLVLGHSFDSPHMAVHISNFLLCFFIVILKTQLYLLQHQVLCDTIILHSFYTTLGYFSSKFLKHS